MIWVHADGEYCHIIQSRHPAPPSVPKENSNVPFDATLIIIQVGFSSPASKQPELLEEGFIEGLEIGLLSNSSVLPDPFGSTAKLLFVQMLTAFTQSLAVA